MCPAFGAIKVTFPVYSLSGKTLAFTFTNEPILIVLLDAHLHLLSVLTSLYLQFQTFLLEALRSI